jgi:hypothetical protein
MTLADKCCLGVQLLILSAGKVRHGYVTRHKAAMCVWWDSLSCQVPAALVRQTLPAYAYVGILDGAKELCCTGSAEWALSGWAAQANTPAQLPAKKLLKPADMLVHELSYFN